MNKIKCALFAGGKWFDVIAVKTNAGYLIYAGTHSKILAHHICGHVVLNDYGGDCLYDSSDDGTVSHAE